jgi:ribosomal protein S18 acetylase RimI-like enzyme
MNGIYWLFSNHKLGVGLRKSGTVKIRRAISADADSLLELYQGLYPELKGKISSFKLPKADTETFIANYGVEPAGFVILTFISYSQKKTGFGYIEELFVKKRYRSLGIGKMLVNSVILWCKKRGYNVIFLTTPKTNIGAIKFYRHLGFRKSKQVWLQYINKKKKKQ